LRLSQSETSPKKAPSRQIRPGELLTPSKADQNQFSAVLGLAESFMAGFKTMGGDPKIDITFQVTNDLIASMDVMALKNPQNPAFQKEIRQRAQSNRTGELMDDAYTVIGAEPDGHMLFETILQPDTIPSFAQFIIRVMNQLAHDL